MKHTLKCLYNFYCLYSTLSTSAPPKCQNFHRRVTCGLKQCSIHHSVALLWINILKHDCTSSSQVLSLGQDLQASIIMLLTIFTGLLKNKRKHTKTSSRICYPTYLGNIRFGEMCKGHAVQCNPVKTPVNIKKHNSTIIENQNPRKISYIIGREVYMGLNVLILSFQHAGCCIRQHYSAS